MNESESIVCFLKMEARMEILEESIQALKDESEK
jgi:hypothetical protein